MQKSSSKLRKNLKGGNRGITLITLVVTIIVLLILAGISIQMLTGNSGILTQASNAKEQTEISSIKERVELAVTSAILNSPNYQLTTEKLKEELQKEFKSDYKSLLGNDTWTFETNKHIWLISSDGKVTTLNNYKIYGNVDCLIPNEYQRVEYIESTGTQYINTSIVPSADLKWTATIKYINPYGTFDLSGFGMGIASTVWVKFDIKSQTKIAIQCGKTNSETKISIDDINKLHIYTMDILNKKCSFDDDTYDLNISDLEKVNQELFLFKVNGISNSNTYARLYLSKIFIQNSCIRNFIPCVNTSNRKIGLYDTTKNTFYTNQGTGEFSKGKIAGVGNPTDDDKDEIPLEIITSTNDVISTTLTLNAPLRKVEDTADYIDLKNKKVVRYISENGEIFDTPKEESFEVDNLPDIKDILSIDVLTDIEPSKIEACE